MDGSFELPYLLPGVYELSVEKAQFQKLVRQGITLFGTDRVTLDIVLELGPVSESVFVVGGQPLLQTNSATRLSVLDNRILESVPAGGRNVFALQYDQPGVNKASTYWGSMELYAFGNVNAVIINGGKIGENETVIDGLTDTKSDRGVAFIPALSAIEEFTVQTNSTDAQYGRVGGGVSLINLKSGTNAFHGQIYDYFKNDKLRANDWVANKNGEPRSPFKNNTFGFELDGPVVLPKPSFGRNRLFFLLAFEGLREHSAGGQVRTLPLAEQMKGDFSHLFDANGQLITIYDPLSTHLGPDGKTYIRSPFPGNIIPAERINPIAAQIASFYPAANLAGDGPSHANNYSKVLPETNGYDSWLGKIDLMVTERSRVSFRYGQTPWLSYSGLVWGNNPAEPSNRYPSTRIPRNWGADWTYSLTPRTVINLRGGLTRYEAATGNNFGDNYDPRKLGFPNSLVAQFARSEFPRFNIGSYSEIGSNGVLSYATQDVWSLQPSISFYQGRHSLRFGTELRRYNDNSVAPGLASGSYSFNSSWTQANPQRSDSLSGNEFASFLLGYPASGFVDRNIDPAYRSNYYSLFVQDDFRVSTRLALNLGLRWDYEAPRTERYDRMVGGFAFDQLSPIAASVRASPAASNCLACAAGLTGGLLYAGTGGRSSFAFDPHKRNFQPRVGAVYRMSSRLVFRGGYALSYLGQNSAGLPTGYSQQTPLVASLDNGLTPAVSLSDPFPTSLYPTGLLTPIGNTQGLATNLGQNISFQYLDRSLPYSQQYSAGFQYQFKGGWLADASYVGNITRRLPVTLPVNFIPSATLDSIPVSQRQAYFNQQIPNPMAGLLPNSALNGATVARQQLLFAFPQYGSGTQMTDVPIGKIRYDSAQMKLTRRFSDGLAMTIAYTISKNLEQVSTLNAQDTELASPLTTKLEKRLVQFDVPRQLSIIGTFDLPVGRGKRFGAGMGRWANGVLGGWTVSGVFMSHSGFPLAFPNAAPLQARSGNLTDEQRDTLAQKAGRPQYDPSYDVWFDTSLFPRTTQAPFTLRTFPTRFPDVRSKPLNVMDLSISKEIPLTEHVKWQIRCDVHNAANFPFFGDLDSNGANVVSPLFGHLRADIGNETRVIVGVAKLVF